MTHTPQRPPARQLALDNLRALMMWLGIVLHVAVIYMAGDAILPWRDAQRTPLADLLMAFIHAFRMPVFFILAGFFVALLLQSRGPAGLARHRLRRLGLPFVVFWPPIFVACVLLALAFMHRMARGTWGLDPALMRGQPGAREGLNTMHMWFLWMLLWFSLASAAVARWVPAAWLRPAGALLQRLGGAWWGPVVLMLPLLWAGLDYPRGLLRPDGAFLPAWQEWVHNGMFFLFGVALFHQQWALFDLYRRRWWAYAVAGLVPFLLVGALMQRGGSAPAIGAAYNLASWLWSFAALGLALRVLDRRSPLLAWLADSSYWVYLVHMPLTIGFGALLYGLPLHALAKMAINIAATTAVCLLTYQLFVRSTWVGQLLNGKRHPRRNNESQGLLHASP